MFALEDLYGLQPDEKDGEIKLNFSNASVLRAVKTWAEQNAKLKAGEITKEEYDEWRYNYPKYDTDSEYVKLPINKRKKGITDCNKSVMPKLLLYNCTCKPE